MSRLGKKTIAIPAKTEVTIAEEMFTAKGPLGELSLTIHPKVKVEKTEEGIVVSPRSKDLASLALWGTFASHVRNIISGVNTGYTKKLILEGIGYKADVKGDELLLALGFSHPVKVSIPKSLKVVSEKGVVTITGINKDEVGQFAASTRSLKKPEPYKGKGFRYDGEVIRRKQGKKSA
jgi:large subunit ribosomal protein L6